MQLTYGQYLIEKNREQPIRTSPSDDDTNYEKINWYNDMKTSFANKELADLVKEICNFVSFVRWELEMHNCHPYWEIAYYDDEDNVV
ncbi:hypothetical protein [Bacillus cereus group sp. BfR-BA-01346]|uniref:hypothetical protein n=1 Tax=Bacillus cereus group sp. BfR-BA-01346 TaxID=2920309 RepID=UPI001E45FC51|nr:MULTISPECIES: hypothetical protein [Bacillus cereus group]MCC0768571.1 hypothetical protein [Bacillus pacificus]